MGYLNTEQIALLLNKNIQTIETQKKKLLNLKMLNVDTLPKKNYFTLTSKAHSHLGREQKKHSSQLLWTSSSRFTYQMSIPANRHTFLSNRKWTKNRKWKS